MFVIIDGWVLCQGTVLQLWTGLKWQMLRNANRAKEVTVVCVKSALPAPLRLQHADTRTLPLHTVFCTYQPGLLRVGQGHTEWAKGMHANSDSRIGKIVQGPDRDGEVKLQWIDDGSTSGWIKAATLSVERKDPVACSEGSCVPLRLQLCCGQFFPASPLYLC